MEPGIRLRARETENSSPFKVVVVLVSQSEDSGLARNLDWFRQMVRGMVRASYALIELEVLEAGEAAQGWAEVLMQANRIVILQEGERDYLPGEVSVIPTGQVGQRALWQSTRNSNREFWRMVGLQTLASRNPSMFIVEFGWPGYGLEFGVDAALHIVRELIWQVVEWSRS